MTQVEESKVDEAIHLYHTRDANGRHLFEGKDFEAWMQQADALGDISHRRFSEAALAYALECIYIAGKLVRMDFYAATGERE